MDFREVKPEEWGRVVQALSNNFFDDPLYTYLFPDKGAREKSLPIHFDAYLKLLKPYSDIITDSVDIKVLGVIYLPSKDRKVIMYYMRVLLFLIRSLEIIPYVGIREFLRIIRTLRKMSSTWIPKYKLNRFTHLDLAIVDFNCRGKGYFGKMLKYIETQYNIRKGKVLTLETHNYNNVKTYEYLGFSLVEKIEIKESSLIQYCMIKKL